MGSVSASYLAIGGPRLFPAEAKFIQVDLHPQELGMNRPLDAAILGDARLALEAFADAGSPPRTDWLDRVLTLGAAGEDQLAAGGTDPARFFHPPPRRPPRRRPLLLRRRRLCPLGSRHTARP